MGACNSCEAASAVSGTATVKVVLSDGGLREYLQPVKAACVLGKDARGFFVCDADAMEMDGYVGAVGAGEELRPGQLYFVLPRSMRKRQLHADAIKALAVKASSALVGRRGKGAVAPMLFLRRWLKRRPETGAERRRGLGRGGEAEGRGLRRI